jgi:hypothetical protein
MGVSDVLDDLDEALTQSSKVAASLGDDFLVYMIDMAVLHVRKKAIHVNDNVDHRLRTASTHLAKSSKGRGKKHPLALS